MANQVSFVFKLLDKYSKFAKKISETSGRMAKKFKRVKKDGKAAGKQITKLAKTTDMASRKFKAGFARMAAAALGFFGIKAFIQKGAEFQDAIAELSAITGIAGEKLDILSDASLRMSKIHAISATEIAGAFKIVGSNLSEIIKTPGALEKVTESILVLKNAAKIDLAEAARVTVEALNQYGASANETAKFVDILAAGSKVGASEVGQTGVAIVKSAVLAKKAGLSFAQLNATIQVLAKGGIKSELAGTGLRIVFTRLEKHINKKFRPSVVGLDQALENLAKKNFTVAEETKLFGDEAATLASILISKRALIKDWTKLVSISGTAQEQATKNLSTFNAKMRILGTTIQASLIKTFLRLEPVLTKQVEAMTEFFDSIDDQQINDFADALKGIASALSSIGTAFRFVSSIFKGTGTALGELVAQFATLDFSAETSTSFREAFSSGGRFLGGGDKIKARVVSNFTSAEEFKKLSGREVKVRTPAIDKFKPGSVTNISNLTDIEKQNKESTQILNATPTVTSSSQTDINVKLVAPEKVIESISIKSKGNVSGLNIGTNMVETL